MSAVSQKFPVVGSAVTGITELSKVTQQNTPLMRELRIALDTLEETLEQGSHASIQTYARHTVSVLKRIFDLPNSENFKNTNLISTWSRYLSPLTNLLTLLQQYLNPGLTQQQPTLSRLQQALTPAQDLVKGEVNYQQGLIARLVSTAADQLKKEVKKTAQDFTSSPLTVETEAATHPLLEISRLIAIYKTHGNDYLPISRENHLSAALRHFDQKSILFKGVEAFVYEEIDEGTLHEHLDILIQRISIFIQTKRDERIYQFVYDHANRKGEVNYRSRSCDPQKQIAWGKQYIQGLAKLSTERQMARFERLWIAAAESDEVQNLEQFAKSMQQTVNSPTQLSQNLDKAICFFQKNLDKKLSQDVLKVLTAVAASWLSLTYTWMSEHLESSELHELEDRFNHLKQQMNRGRYLEALNELKEELQKSPLAKEIHKEGNAVSPLNTIQQVRENLIKALSPKQGLEKASWDTDMEKEKQRFVDQVSYISMFKIFYRLTSQKQSNTAYARIMTKVVAVPKKEQRNVFLKELKSEVDQRSDISYFRKLASKAIAGIIMTIVHSSTQHFIRSFIDYLTNTLSLPARRPLSNIHLSPVSRINDCFIAQKKALSRWASDERGEEFGASGLKKSMEVALRDPKLNNNYKHNELVDRTTHLAIDKFLNIGLRATFSKPIRFIAKWIAKRIMSYTVLDSMKNSLYKQSQYTHAIDGVLLDQLLKVEQLLDKGGRKAIEHEGEEAKKLFRETVANVVYVIDLNRNLTAESMRAEQSSRDNAVSVILDTVKKKTDEQLCNAIVQLLIISYQSILTEDQMNALILKIFRKTNDSLLPQTAIQLFYSESEKANIAKTLGRKPTDSDLKKRFAQDHGKRVEDLSDIEIQAQLKVKFNKIEQELQETTFRIIKKSVHQVVQDEGKNALISANQAVISYIDFMDRYLFKNNASRPNNLFRKMDQLLRNLESAEDEATCQEIIQSFHKESITFLSDYEKKQQLLDRKVIGKDRAAAHMRRINEISNTAIMPQLITFEETLKEFIRNPNAVSIQKLRLALKVFDENVHRYQAEFEQIKREQLRLPSHRKTLLEKTRIWGNKIVQHGAPVALDQVELYANHRLNQIAEGALHLYKDPNVFESFLRHVVMLNFVESFGHTKPIKT